MSLEKYLNDQHGYGKSQGIGQFTINAAKAKLKLQRYQLNDPLRYLLKIVQAAVAGGAAWVDIKQSRFDTEVIFELPTTSPLTRKNTQNVASRSSDPAIGSASFGVRIAGPENRKSFATTVATPRDGAAGDVIRGRLSRGEE